MSHAAGVETPADVRDAGAEEAFRAPARTVARSSKV